MSNLQQLDNQLIWHPFSQESLEPDNLIITHGKGAYVYDEQGRSYLDLVSSWWVNLHGHAHPTIVQSIEQQASKLEHIMFSGFTHQPAIRLCELLSEVLPRNLKKFFYSDNGSTAVEVAIKMAYQYWILKGEHSRKLFLSFEGAYHGDTFGAMALGQSSGFHDPFQELLFQVLTVPYPATWEEDEDLILKEQHALNQLESILHQYPNQIAAMIIEPLVQGSSGMRMCRTEFLKQVVSMLRAQDILIIFDEVMTGFGRTGKHFAIDYLKTEVDFICLSKGLSGGFLPLALTVTTLDIYQTFAQQSTRYTFSHGHSYTANPLACAAGIASLELLVHPNTQKQQIEIARAHQDGFHILKKQHPKDLQHYRQLGTIGAFSTTFPINHNFKHQALSSGLIIRPLKHHLYLLPPYCIHYEECLKAYEILSELIKNNKLIRL